jgi:putative ABC transport system permease protein
MIAVGLLIALATTRGASSLLFGLQSNDPLAFAGASVLLIVIALLAGFLPALRASRVDPVVALRCE